MIVTGPLESTGFNLGNGMASQLAGVGKLLPVTQRRGLFAAMARATFRRPGRCTALTARLADRARTRHLAGAPVQGLVLSGEHMSVGLLGLIDDVVGIAKIAAASIDDAAGQAARAGAKAAGLVVDDTAVTPRFLVGFAAERELPIIAKITVGSLRNKLVFLLPAALLLSLVAPWAITPLLMVGGLYLSFEGAEKVMEALGWHPGGHGSEAAEGDDAVPAPLLSAGEEARRVKGAIRTDFILSAEIMAITLATVAASPFVTRAIVLAIVGVVITLAVYGVVALIVKADDAGLLLAARDGPVSGPLGRGLVRVMPHFLQLLSFVGTAAMLWVGGGIILHGLEELGLAAPQVAVHHAGEVLGRALGAVGPIAGWLVGALASAVLALGLGAIAAVVVQRVAPAAVH